MQQKSKGCQKNQLKRNNHRIQTTFMVILFTLFTAERTSADISSWGKKPTRCTAPFLIWIAI
ncbi:hypothetical protein BCY86_03190 [Pajaroellobacter abortibovis]|uniref:Uncharacterized protein n=1 Tax=Pajaroellobacter abortibovis TaxID=1882918 RepID=A0A1L6MW64_9BACT|nr:hypothetical protein BCY86_03190 [Pajaroellobacter abortibovis]